MPYAVGLTFRDGKPLVYHGGDFPHGQATALALADYDGFRARQASARAQGRYIGIGIGNYVEGTGLGPFEGVTVRVLTNGKVAVATGATNQGQGTAHDALADRRRRGRLPDRGHRDDHRRHRRDLARASAPSRAGRRSMRAPRRSSPGRA